MDAPVKKITIPISDTIGKVSGLVTTAKGAKAVLVLAHGAGAGMTHPFMETLAKELSALGISTVRYNFSYMEKKQGRPDPPAVAEKTVALAIETAHTLFPKLPLFAGGKSFGGRMSSQRLSKDCPDFVKGIIFYGFPLHPLGAPGIERAAHLKDVPVPMLFLHGIKDNMAQPPLLKKVIKGLPLAELHSYEGADHSFKAGKQNLIPTLAQDTATWISGLKPQ